MKRLNPLLVLIFYCAIISEPMPNQLVQQRVSGMASGVVPSKSYRKQSPLTKNECIAKPIPLGPSGPAVKQLLTGGKLDTSLSVNKADDPIKRYDDCLLSSAIGGCRDANAASGISFPHLQSSARADSANSNLYRQPTPNTIQSGVHISTPPVSLPGALTNTFPSGLQPQLQAGIRSTGQQIQRGLLGPSTVTNNNLHSGIFAPNPCVAINIQSDALNTKTINPSPLTGKILTPMLPDLSYSLQNFARTQPAIVSSQQQPSLNVGQPPSGLNLQQLSSVMGGIQLQPSIPVVSPVSHSSPSSSNPFPAVNERSVNGIANFLQNTKQQAESVSVSRDQLGLSQDLLEAKLKAETLARLVVEQATIPKLLQQQQQTQLATATLQSVAQDHVANPAVNNVLLQPCFNMPILQQFKNPSTPNNLSSLLLPANPLASLLTSQTSYVPLTSRPDLIANGVVNNGICEFLGVPARNVNNLLDARNVTSL